MIFLQKERRNLCSEIKYSFPANKSQAFQRETLIFNILLFINSIIRIYILVYYSIINYEKRKIKSRIFYSIRELHEICKRTGWNSIYIHVCFLLNNHRLYFIIQITVFFRKSCFVHTSPRYRLRKLISLLAVGKDRLRKSL